MTEQVQIAIELPVVGCQHRNFSVGIFEDCQKYGLWGEEFNLIPEPYNAFDPGAMKVMLRSVHVGYVAKDSADEALALLEAMEVLNIGFESFEYHLEKYKYQGDKLQWFTLNMLVTVETTKEEQAKLDKIYA
jgi:hypothetical protein